MRYVRFMTVQARGLNLDTLLDDPIDRPYKSFPTGYVVIDAILTYF